MGRAFRSKYGFKKNLTQSTLTCYPGRNSHTGAKTGYPSHKARVDLSIYIARQGKIGLILTQLGVKNFRNLQLVFLEPSSSINFIVGKNGAGKSALLESIYMLGRGRSFRTRNNSRLIGFGEDRFQIRSRMRNVNTHNLDLSFDGTALSASLDGRKISSRSQLLQMVTVGLLSDAQGTLIEGGPEIRRNFLNWLVFHVEPSAVELIGNLKKIRVSLAHLMLDSTIEERKPWYRQYSEYSQKLVDLYQVAIERLLPHLSKLSDRFPFLCDISIELRKGWSAGSNLHDILLQQDRSAKKRGHLLVGPQRSDIHVKKNDRVASDYLSNGEKRIFSILLILSALTVISETAGHSVIVLLDDLEAEIDKENQRLLLEILFDTNFQAFVTTTETAKFDVSATRDVRVFHVEHGHVELKRDGLNGVLD